METSFVLVVVLSLPREKTDLFRDCEQKAARIMARHGGRVEKVMEAAPKSVLTEIHWVVFPTEEAFSDYQKDPELLGLQPLRLESGVETKVWRGHSRAVYGHS
jgi:hypothetical protein